MYELYQEVISYTFSFTHSLTLVIGYRSPGFAKTYSKPRGCVYGGKKSSGPRTESCGTPPLTFTNCYLFEPGKSHSINSNKTFQSVLKDVFPFFLQGPHICLFLSIMTPHHHHHHTPSLALSLFTPFPLQSRGVLFWPNEPLCTTTDFALIRNKYAVGHYLQRGLSFLGVLKKSCEKMACEIVACEHRVSLFLSGFLSIHE